MNIDTHNLPLNEGETPQSAEVNASSNDHAQDVFQGQEDVEQIDEVKPDTPYHEMTREQLLVHFEELMKMEDTEQYISAIKKITDAYEHLAHEREDKALNEFILSGKAREEFQFEIDELDKKFRSLNSKYMKIRTEYRKKREKLQQDSLEEKKKIIDELKSLTVNEANYRTAFDKLHELQERWRKTGAIPRAQGDDLYNTYRFHIDRFYDLLKINKELRELDQKKNQEIKKDICGQAEQLILEPSINKSISRLRNLQDQWKEVGPAPRDVSETLWQRFRAAADKIFERRKEHMGDVEKQQSESLAKKTALCEKLEKLLENEPKSHKKWQEIFTQVDACMNEWKQAGFASRKDNLAIWERFRNIRKSLFEKRDSFYENQRKEFANNFKLKTDLCLQAEALLESGEYKQAADQFKKLQDQWKTLGPVTPRQSDKIWNRFRAACNAFFERRKEHFNSREKEMDENLKKKIELIKELEGFQASSDHEANLNSIKVFQDRWLQIGMVPFKDKDRIYKSYSDALRRHMGQVKPDSQKGREALNKMKYRTQGTGGSRSMMDEKSKVQDRISKLQKDMNVLENNLSFLGKSENANLIRIEFLNKIDSIKTEIDRLKGDLKLMAAAV